MRVQDRRFAMLFLETLIIVSILLCVDKGRAGW